MRQNSVDKDAEHSETNAEGAVPTITVRVIASDVFPAPSAATTPIEIVPSGNERAMDQSPLESATAATVPPAYDATTE